MKKPDANPESWCDAGGQLLGFGTSVQPGQVIACELCGKNLKVVARFGDFGYPAYPRHKKQPVNPAAKLGRREAL
jgi:hypothetical protein